MHAPSHETKSFIGKRLR